MARPHRSTRIIQIIPALGWTIEYKREDGLGPNTKTNAACFALHSDGEIALMDAADDGQIFEAAEMSNFVRCYYSGLE
jgi:hypothetical protein